ncbi:hypothetical protein PDG61_13655 [Mycolicibacterium sp. BiH015]|uniref:hypothetical protein n=1 Tax=Mycolicibacterium sp. BiH015 TaxID=3018808 RepID=UPI0022E1B384|nr:hypothetical protein [Mycolicibacterium sp. BiH015]MDA2891965.1 hypothetical protein [Mycolicibacterium sp. BiH015]
MSGTPSPIITDHPVVDAALERFRDAVGPDFDRYRNHVYRGLNYQRWLMGIDDVPADVALAWALHDVGIWTSGWDYLPPSLRHVAELADEFGISDTSRATAMVGWHHKLRGCPDPWTETFRVADRIDVSHGLIRSGVPRAGITGVVHAFPYHGFHALLIRTAAAWTKRHPLNPLPMLRW